MRENNRILVYVRLDFSELYLDHPFFCVPVLIPLEKIPEMQR